MGKWQASAHSPQWSRVDGGETTITMANDPTDPFEKQRNVAELALKQDVLHGVPLEKQPERIDWLGTQLATTSRYHLRTSSGKPVELDRSNFDDAIRMPYLKGIRELTGVASYVSALDRNYPLGTLVVQYAGLVEGLKRVGRNDVDPGEVLGRLVTRNLRRRTSGIEADIAADFRVDTHTPREFIEQVLAHPEVADQIRGALPSRTDESELVDKLGEVEIATQLWDHQRDALAKWIGSDGNGYVNMATATGKTVLGLAAVGYCTDGGSLHPDDTDYLIEWFNEHKGDSISSATDLPTVGTDRVSDVLIVTTDDLLGVQWGRLFREHCNTPPEFTRVVDQTISLPWGDIDIRSAGSLDDVPPADYRLAIFDEVHNYGSEGGWGEHLIRFIDSSCPVLALTGSVSDSIERRFRSADAEFPCVWRYTHEEALADGVIPDFEWTLWYAPVDTERSSTLPALREAASLVDMYVEWDGRTYELDASTDEVRSLPGDISQDLWGEFETPTALGRALKAAGEDDCAPTETLDDLASALSNRRTLWWNLRNDLSTVVDLTTEAMAANKPTLVLTRSYAEADEIYKLLKETLDDVQIEKLESGEEGSVHDKRITRFDSWDTDQKVLIGPGDRIGTGNDIQSVEVGINLARSGSGMSSSLIQRLGRLLRRAGEKDGVEFYHLLGVPPTDAVSPMDGEQFVRNAAGFFAQTNTPDRDDGMAKVPGVTVAPTATESIVTLEAFGARALSDDAEVDGFEAAYVDAIEAADGAAPVVDTPWYDGLFDAAVTAPSTEVLTGEGVAGDGTDTRTEDDDGSETTDPDDGPHLATSTDESDDTPLVVTVVSESGTAVYKAFVSVVGDGAAAHGRTNLGGKAGFDLAAEKRCTIAVRHPDYRVTTDTVAIETEPRDITVTVREC